ncbi:MAG: hypothetical protein ACE5KM_09740 [Planctomycetaceae bacterium]
MNKKPEPLFTEQQRAVCPVCGQAAYSRAGIHPQCAQVQADEKRVARLKKTKAKTRPDSGPASPVLKAWHKKCPKCGKQLHVRKSTCGCGYSFAARTKSQSG